MGNQRLNLAVIACEVFQREFETLARELPHTYTFHFQPFGLHDTPEKLCAHLQTVVDATTDADAILIGYGLCSRGIVGLTTREIPLVVPRAHDCMTFFLGSRKRYTEEFTANPGTYYYSPGWIERNNPNISQSHFVPNSQQRKAAQARKFAEYAAKYGEENAAYLIEVESQWRVHYTRAAFIDTGVGDRAVYRAFVQNIALANGWEYAEIDGKIDLMWRFLSGEWDGDFLFVPPHARIRDTINEDIIAIESPKGFAAKRGEDSHEQEG